VALAGLLLLVGCSDPPLSPEERIRQLFDEAEAAVESRDLPGAAGLISANYKDASQRNYQALRGLLAGYLLRHKSIHLLQQVESLKLQGGRQATAVLYVGAAGQRSPAIESLSQWTGDLIRLELALTLEEDDQWRLSAAQWRRASRGDLLQ
jgi:hypothetical protein